MGNRVVSTESRPVQLRSQLLRLCSAVALNAQPEDVHKLRTTIRRLELYIPKDSQMSGARRLAKQLTRIRKLGGKVRDIDIQLGLLASIQQTEVLHARDQVASVLRRRRDKRASKLGHVLETVLESGLGKRLVRVIPQGSNADTQTQNSLAQVQSEYAALAQSIPEDGDALHDFRKSVKTMRYKLEAVQGADAAALAKRLKAVQDALGVWHDWVSLAELAEAKLRSDRLSFVAFLRSRVVARRNEARHAAAALRDELAFPREVRKPPTRASRPIARRAVR